MLEYEGSIWRPPSEAQSLILQATVGCSHNACTYCVSYKGKHFRVRGVEGIKSDLAHLTAMQKRTVKRVFLADGNALTIDTDEMLEILAVLKQEIPSLERVGVYGYAKDVRSKSIEEMRQIHSSGLGIAYFGLETGDDEILRDVRKGVSSEENVAACKKIREAGIPVSVTIILGLGGKGLSERHAVHTARALNEIDPEYVGALTLMIPRGTPLFDMVQQGEFEPMEPFDTLRELRLLVENLELSECVFRTNHASNYFPIGGTLSHDKEAMLSVISRVVSSEDESTLRPGYLRGL
ncbi:MAG: radical SAM protein [Candidatus Thorarchaeota archaeon]|nr:MAG: radical SAM protein [Candidatus Thorarchaeota archaeon]